MHGISFNRCQRIKDTQGVVESRNCANARAQAGVAGAAWPGEFPTGTAVKAIDSCNQASIAYMASITIRKIDDSIKTRLRIRAAGHGRSVEGEVREILKSVLNSEKPEQINFAESVRRRFAALGGVTLPDVVREPLHQPTVAVCASSPLAVLSRRRDIPVCHCYRSRHHNRAELFSTLCRPAPISVC